MSRIFRKVALERLASPEQLDQLVKIISPAGWFSLLSLGLLLAATLFWGIWGKIPTTVAGGGILIKTGGIVEIEAPIQGQLTSIYVSAGDLVRRGQVIARIEQPQLREQVQSSKQELDELVAQFEKTKEYGNENIRLQTQYLAKEKENLVRSIDIDQERLKWFDEKIGIQEQLQKEGLLTRQSVITTRSQRDDLKKNIETLKNKLKGVEVDVLNQKNRQEQEILLSQIKMNNAKRNLQNLQEKLEYSTKVISSHTGRVVEIRFAQGDVVTPGTPIINLELTGDRIQDLQAVIFVPPNMGKQVKTGMHIRISPTTVPQEEYGFMYGIVTRVSEFPATRQGMVQILANDQLAQQFTQMGAPITVYVDLVPNPTTLSGYKWSSPAGPPTKIYSGTMCTASVEVKSQPPISLVIPYLKKKMGI